MLGSWGCHSTTQKSSSHRNNTLARHTCTHARARAPAAPVVLSSRGGGEQRRLLRGVGRGMRACVWMDGPRGLPHGQATLRVERRRARKWAASGPRHTPRLRAPCPHSGAARPRHRTRAASGPAWLCGARTGRLQRMKVSSLAHSLCPVLAPRVHSTAHTHTHSHSTSPHPHPNSPPPPGRPTRPPCSSP